MPGPIAIVLSWVRKPMNCARRVPSESSDLFAGIVMVYLPSKSATAPRLASTINTVAPWSGLSAESVMVPEMDDCAKAVAGEPTRTATMAPLLQRAQTLTSRLGRHGSIGMFISSGCWRRIRTTPRYNRSRVSPN